MRSVRWGVRADLFFFKINLIPSVSLSFATSQITYLCTHAMAWFVDNDLLVNLPG